MNWPESCRLYVPVVERESKTFALFDKEGVCVAILRLPSTRSAHFGRFICEQ